jgi:hypothetical protein
MQEMFSQRMQAHFFALMYAILKQKHGSQLSAAVGIDPNECIYPIAMGVVEVESTITWKWFLATLKNNLNIINTGPYTIMSDKQKVHHKTFS